MKQKKRFMVVAEMTISVSVYVDAESEEEASALAEKAPIQTFCHQCASGADDEWSAGELDGEPTIIEITEV